MAPQPLFGLIATTTVLAWAACCVHTDTASRDSGSTGSDIRVARGPSAQADCMSNCTWSSDCSGECNLCVAGGGGLGSNICEAWGTKCGTRCHDASECEKYRCSACMNNVCVIPASLCNRPCRDDFDCRGGNTTCVQCGPNHTCQTPTKHNLPCGAQCLPGGGQCGTRCPKCLFYEQAGKVSYRCTKTPDGQCGSWCGGSSGCNSTCDYCDNSGQCSTYAGLETQQQRVPTSVQHEEEERHGRGTRQQTPLRIV